MADDPLHDNDRSPRREKVTEREKITERDAEEKTPDADKPVAGGKEPAPKPAPEEGGGEGGDADVEMKERREMFKRHETERTDHHGLHTRALKDMQRRHDKEWKSMLFKQQNEMMPAEGAPKPKKTPLHGGEEE